MLYQDANQNVNQIFTNTLCKDSQYLVPSGFVDSDQTKTTAKNREVGNMTDVFVVTTRSGGFHIGAIKARQQEHSELANT